MSKEEKAQTIEQLQASFSKCSVGILTEYRGLTAPEITALRRKLREAGIEYKVVKNTLARLAAGRAGKPEMASFFAGPLAIAFGYSDVATPAKVLSEYTRTAKTSLVIKGGFLGNRPLTVEDIATLTKLPPREVLIAKVLGGMQSPIVSLLNCLTGPMRGLMVVLQARMKQMEGE